MPDVKNQHYVPQFYLRRFIANNELVYVFDKFTKKSFRTKIRNIASETRFYDIHPDIYEKFREYVTSREVEQDGATIIAEALHPQMIEHELAEREAKFATLFEAVLEAIYQRKSITHEQRWHLAEFLVMQFLRIPEYRREQIDLQTNVTTELLRRMFIMSNKHETDFHVRYDERYASLAHARLMFDPDMQRVLRQTLVCHIWLIGINMTESPFYTSDTPIVKRSHFNDPQRGTGFGSFSIEVAFPLTPMYMLILRERTAFPHLEQFDLRTLPLTSGNVTYYNSLQVFQSYRYVYSPSGDFLMAADICSQQPEICLQDRNRWKIY